MNEKAVMSATVSLHKLKDSSVAKLAITDKQGEFEFDKIADGKYFVSVSAVGFKKVYSSSVDINSANNIVAHTDFQLSTASQSLGQVVVTAKRPLVENKIDRTVLNVEASITNAVLTALDVLEKSPGVSVDNNGVISLKGKQGVIVLMDGKQTYLSGNDLATLLKNMPANQLDQIEIMTQPPAKYDASGNSGLINIKTKKNTQKGYNGSVNLGYIQAIYPKTTNNFNFNYRNSKINLFSNYSYSYWVGFSDINIDRYFGRTADKFDALFDQFKFKKGWGAEISGFYRTKLLVSGLIIGEPMGVLSFGASKQILKGKGNIRLNLNDPFWLQYFRGYTKFGNIDTHIQSKWDNRRIVLNFSYRFSKGQNVQQRRRNGGASDEQNRVGQGTQQ
ncbi:MAG: outer membrane beta-barrel protein [Sphingobacteriales bacterium]|nr:outer membrane beta-barrel protein [Sphingobacteriales bacterium]